MLEKTPDLNEAHVDGGFGSPAVDIVAKEQQVNIIQTAVKGNIAKVPIKVQGNEDIGFMVSCPHPQQDAAPIAIGVENLMGLMSR